MNWLKVENKADKTVEIDIEGVIGGSWFFDGVTMEQVNKDLKAINAIDADKIKVNIINSPGGSVLHGLGIIDILNSHKAEKEVNILGMAASMAAVISMIAPKEKRTMTKNSWFLIHRLTGAIGGTINNIESGVEFFKKNEAKLIDILSAGIGKSKDETLSIMNENDGLGVFKTAQESKDAGYVGNIAGDEPVSMAAFTNEIPQLPELPKNLIKTNDMNAIEKLIAGLKGLFDEKANQKQLDVQVAELKSAYEAESKKSVKLISEKEKEIEKLKAERDGLQAKLNGRETPIAQTPDPVIGESKTELGKEIIGLFTDEQKRTLINNKKKLTIKN